MCNIYSYWHLSPLYCCRSLFSNNLLLAISSQWLRREETVWYDWLPLSVSPFFVAMGDTFLLLMQYQHCCNRFLFPLCPDSVISSPALILCLFFISSISLSALNLLSPPSLFRRCCYSLHATVIYILTSPFFHVLISLWSSTASPLGCLADLYSVEPCSEGSSTRVYRVRSVPSFWVSGTCWEKGLSLHLFLLCPKATCVRLTRIINFKSNML